jgi:hypothetical protein
MTLTIAKQNKQSQAKPLASTCIHTPVFAKCGIFRGLAAERRENATQSVQEPANPSQTTKYRRMYSCRGTSRIVLDYVLS